MSDEVKRMVLDPENEGKHVEGVVVNVVDAKEPFTHIKLEDGTTMTMRTVVLEVVRMKNRWDANGNPIYNISSHASLMVNSPNNLKKGE